MHSPLLPAWIIAPLLLLVACTPSNNILLGTVKATVDGHAIVVTDCYRITVPPPVRLSGTPAGARYAPCRDAVVVIRGVDLEVNGTPYPALHPGESVTVDHGTVLVNGVVPRAASR
jgi:hypothetical protein